MIFIRTAGNACIKMMSLIAPEIVLAPYRKHAWLALKVIDAGDSERYIQWTIKGVKYNYIEATVPQIVKY